MGLSLGTHRKAGDDMCREIFAGSQNDTESQLEFIKLQLFDDVMAVKRIAKLEAE